MTPQEIRRHVGQRVTLQLSPQAPGEPTVTGRLVGALEAADGLVITLEPDGAPPGVRFTYHYHHIVAVLPTPPPS